MKKLLSFLFICLLAFLVIGCNKPADNGDTPSEEVKYSLNISDADKKVSLEVDATKKITVTVEGGTVEWSSSNESVVTVSGGTLTAVSAGTAVVTAKLKEKADIKVEIENKLIVVTESRLRQVACYED